MAVILFSEVTCPNCGFKKLKPMPVDTCQFFYECTNCFAVLQPVKRDCCIFCSYGTIKCPPMQENGALLLAGRINSIVGTAFNYIFF